MSAPRWSEVEALFAGGLDRPAAEREAWVRSEATSPNIADEVLELLGAHDRTGLFDGVVESVEASSPTPHLESGARLGAWEVIGVLGQGGMGVVYRVRRADGQFEQEAALKILPAGASDEHARARFLAERQILARLSHPNIARLLDGGIGEDGRPWFVMEHVVGEPIDRYCGARGLARAERIRLLRSVCGAVQYAHRQLVVHRDLKAANVLVDDQGVPKLLDFGIAGEEASEGASPGTGPRYLTPGASSPEQLRGDAVTTASDVYQLGLLIRRVLEESGGASGSAPPERPARLDDELAAIVARATREDAAERYGSAGRLADDLGRYLAHEPVRARPRTWGYVTRKFLRRHALPVGVATVAFLGLTWSAVQIERNARAARLERDRAEEVVDLLVSLFQSADPLLALDDSVLVRDVLDQGVVRLRDELAGQPAVRATLLAVIGEVYSSLGLSEQARALLDEALAEGDGALGSLDPDVVEWAWRLGMLEATGGDFARADTLLTRAEAAIERGDLSDRDVARALNDVGYARQVMGELDRAEALLGRAIEAWTAVPDAGSRPAATYTNLGWLRISLGDPDSAEVLFRRGLELRRAELDSGHPQIATSLESLATVLFRTGKLDEAEAATAEALRIREALVPPDHPLVLALRAQQASTLRARGDLATAEEILRDVLALRIAALGEEHFLVAFTRNDLALVLVGQGRDAEAEPIFRAALEGQARTYGMDHRNTTIAEVNLARLLVRTGQTSEAESRLARVVPLLREQYPNDRRFLGDLVSLGFLRCSRSDARGVEDLRTAALALADPPGSDERLRALNALADCQERLGLESEAWGTVETSLAESSGRADDDPFRAYTLGVRARLGGG